MAIVRVPPRNKLMTPATPEALDLLHQGATVLAEIECNGMCIDTDYLEKTIRRTERRVARMEADLESTDVVKEWRKRFRSKTNIDSGDQLATVLFSLMGYKSPKKTESDEKESTDEESLKSLRIPFVDQYLAYKKLKKALDTNLSGIHREVVDGKIHPFFNLHTVRTYRSSSDSINFQNQPNRDPDIMKLIRSAFVARQNRQIIEVDLSGAEVRVAACYNKDPRLLDYINDPTTDMHRDTAADLFFLSPDEMTKQIRSIAKGAFVFAEFYGAWYISCAQRMWWSVLDPSIKTAKGVSLQEHMASKGIRELGELNYHERPAPGTFEAVVQKAENVLWKERFVVYDQWRRDWYADYQEKGWFSTYTGFVCNGYMSRKQVISYPIQGSLFHCLLWSLIRLVSIELKKRKMETLIVGQIHDSIVADGPPSEVADFVVLCQRVMVKLLSRQYAWLVTPMAIESEICPVGGSWSDKKKYEVAA